jgi:hypothetical protein
MDVPSLYSPVRIILSMKNLAAVANLWATFLILTYAVSTVPIRFVRYHRNVYKHFISRLV